MANGFRLTQALYVAVRLEIPDRVASGPRDAAALAAASGADADRLHRVLRMLAAHGVFTMDAHGRFGPTPLSEALRPGAPGSVEAFVRFMGEEPYRAFAELLHTVRTGEPAFEKVYGMPHFDYLARHPEASATFHRAMSIAIPPGSDPFDGYDLRSRKVLVDVGGGSGALLGAALAAHPHLHGILFDLPNAVVGAPEVFERLGVAGRCEVRTGSAFDGFPKGGDVYVMSRILHDWPDATALVLLKNCRAALPDDGVLLLREGVLPDSGPPPTGRTLVDLSMMVLPGGRERTEGEWRRLLDHGGFVLGRVIPSAGAQDLIEARPK